MGKPNVLRAQPVYPRPRGVTADDMIHVFEREGLSPPTRGNPRRLEMRTYGERSIPAHAG